MLLAKVVKHPWGGLGALVLAALLSVGAAEQPSKGPFGLTVGMSRAEIERVTGPITEAATGMFAGMVPQPHDDLEVYLFILTESTGLCGVLATSGELQTSAHGVGLRRSFEYLQAQLLETYGSQREVTDQLLEGTIWDEPADFMMGLVKEERVLTARWETRWTQNMQPGDVQKRSAAQKRGIKEIILSAGATASNTGHVSLFYQFNNFDECSEAIEKKKREVL